MKDQKLNKAINEWKKASVMTDEEKNRIFNNIITISHSNTTRTIKSPWTVFSFGIWVKKQRILTSIVVVILIVMLGGGGIVSASQNALPGNILYPIKVRVTEPIQVALAPSEVVKAKVQAGFANRRLIEAEKLTLNGEMDISKEKELNDLLNMHVEDLKKTLNNEGKISKEKSDDIKINFQASMNAHAEVLDIISKQSLAKSDIQASSRIQASSFVEDNNEAKISYVARKNAISIENENENNKDERSNENSETRVMVMSAPTSLAPIESSKKDRGDNSYNERKEKVVRVIESASSSVGFNASSTTPLVNEIMQNAKEKVEKARESLKEADKHNDEGDRDDAESDLRESKKKAVEAEVYIKASKKIEEEENKEKKEKKEDKKEDKKSE